MIDWIYNTTKPVVEPENGILPWISSALFPQKVVVEPTGAGFLMGTWESVSQVVGLVALVCIGKMVYDIRQKEKEPIKVAQPEQTSLADSVALLLIGEIARKAIEYYFKR